MTLVKVRLNDYTVSVDVFNMNAEEKLAAQQRVRDTLPTANVSLVTCSSLNVLLPLMQTENLKEEFPMEVQAITQLVQG